MSTILWSNNATSTLAGAITNVATTANLAAGTGALFPAPSGGQYFCLTFIGTADPLLNEIVHVTGVSGDTITMIRAQEGTTALNWNAGDLAQNLITAATLAALSQADGSNSNALFTNVVGTSRDLVGSAAGGGVTATWTAAELVAETALGGRAYKGASLSLSFNGAGTGAGGMDTGSVPTSLSLSVYAIYNPATTTWSTLGCLASASSGPVYSGAHMPSGYTASVLIWAGVTDSSAHLGRFAQSQRSISIIDTTVINGSVSATSYTSLSISTVIPTIAKFVNGTLNVNASGANAVWVAGDTSAVGQVSFGLSSAALNGGAPFGNLPIITAQTMYYHISSGTATIAIAISSYTI